MRLPPFPGGGGQAWAEFGKGILDLFRQKMIRPFWLWGAATTDLPTLAEQGANEGALAYDTDADAPTWYTGAAWRIAFSTSGGTVTGAITLSFANGGAAMLDASDTGAVGTSSGGLIRVRSLKPTAADQRLGLVVFGATDSSAVIQNTAAITARSTENWGTLAGEGTRLDLEVTANGATSRTVVAEVRDRGLIMLTGSVKLASYTVAGVPSAATHGAGAMIYVSNETGGAVPAFSDGTDWRRVTDRAVIS